MPDETTITHPQLDILRSILQRENDIDKAVETFENDYVHRDHKDADFWKSIAEKIKADETYPEQWLAEHQERRGATTKEPANSGSAGAQHSNEKRTADAG
jgi:hypothetical protein